MNSPNITIKDVAKAANVSVATVSRVLNNKSNVSEEAIQAVTRAVEELGYSPNFIGHDLHKCETRRILVIFHESDKPHYVKLLQGMKEAAAAADYDLIVASTRNSDQEIRLLNMLSTYAVDGAVLISPTLDGKTIVDLSRRHRLAVCPERAESDNVLCVSIDNERAGYDAAKYLIGKGKRRIGLITARERLRYAVDRENGYKRALEEAGIKPDSELVYYGDIDEDSGAAACEELMSRPKKPNAILAVSDIMAVGAMNYAVQHGITIGKELLVFGFDNISCANMLIPKLSTVEQPWNRLGRTAVEKIIANMKSETIDRSTYILPHSLILRESTGD